MRNGWKSDVEIWLVRIGYLLMDTFVLGLAYLGAFLLRFDFQAPQWGWRQVALSFVFVWLVQVIVLFLFGCNRLMWRYFSVGDIPRFVGAISASTLVLLVFRLLLPTHLVLGLPRPLLPLLVLRPPYSISFLNSFLALGGLLGIRFLARFHEEGGTHWHREPRRRARRVLLVGAGAAGNLAARELRRQSVQRLRVVGFLDDDPAKRRAKIQGRSVLGTIEELPAITRRFAVEEVIISMVRVPRDVIRRVVRLCEKSRVPARIVPGYYELLEGTLTVSKIRDVDVADLLGRVERETDEEGVIDLFGNKRTLITGAGGSIGSELVRQVLRTGPEMLIMVERSEKALYEIDREARKAGSPIPIVSLLADAGDRARMTGILEQYKPQLVIHAAAHKHVPLMEYNPVEAIRNNALATRALGEESIAHGVERFVLISTDKAVNPVSVMGTSKRLAEIMVQSLNNRGGTRFSAVRFGNVLDSSGSVVPLFREQIRKGEAVTVTHPEMKRYFMTIVEAVSLVLQAAALAQGGEILVLDMGEPLLITELAEEIIALSGLRPHEDVPIVFTGIRPGEKLFEELDTSERSAYKTGHARIFVSKMPVMEARAVDQIIEKCQSLCSSNMQVHEVRKALLALAAWEADEVAP